MPITYFTELEYKTLRDKSERDINELCLMVKNLLGESCNQTNVSGGRGGCCGRCQFHTYNPDKIQCTSDKKYLSK